MRDTKFAIGETVLTDENRYGEITAITNIGIFVYSVTMLDTGIVTLFYEEQLRSSMPTHK